MNNLLVEFLIEIVFGWPAIIASIVLSIVGVWLKKPVLLIVAGVIGIPFAWYLSGGFRSPVLALPLFQFASAYAVARRKDVIATLLLGPLIVSATVLAYVVVTQP